MELVTPFYSVSSWISCLSLSTSLVTLVLWILSRRTEKLKQTGNHNTFTDDLETQQSFHSDEILVFPGCISHTRLLPKVHSFLYSFLITGVPVRNCKSNWFAAIDNETRPWWRRAWLRVDPPDHLHRGDDEHGLSYKLDRYLESKQYDPAKYPTVWLVTSPRFLGYKSDQASFWYLYIADGRLNLMIIEANNNYSERKVWVVPAADDHDTSTSSETTQKQRRKFHQSWSKEFHVSPFNSRHGFYSISTLDSFPPEKSLDAADMIDITITLLTSQRRPKLVARVWSVSKPLIPSRVSTLYGFGFLASWCLIGPLVQPRTLFQAFRLFQKYRLKIRDRPEPDGKVFPRHSTPAERCIREIFTNYLRQIMNASADKFHLHIRDLSDSSIKMTLSTPTADPKSPGYSISVLTPKFYAIALACPSVDTFLHEALLHKIEERRTACTDVEDPEAFIQLLKHAADSYCRVSQVSDIGLSTFGNGITDSPTTQTWLIKTSKLAILLLLSWVWGCVSVVRAIFLLTMSGDDAGSSISIGGTKKQIDHRFLSHGDICEHVEVTTDSTCFLDQYVHRDCGPGLTLRYLFANLTTVVRERVLSIVGGG